MRCNMARRRRGFQFTERGQRQEEINRDFNSENDIMMSELNEAVEDSFDIMSDSLYALGNAYEQMSEAQSARERNRLNIQFKQQMEQTKLLQKAFDETFSQVREFMSEEQVELIEDLYQEQAKQLRLYNAYYDKAMDQQTSKLGKFFKQAEDGTDGLEKAMGSITNIANALNLNSIRDAVVNGTENNIDIMSEVSRIRGLNYEDVKNWKNDLEGQDLYDGVLNASDIMSVYRMNAVSRDYLEDIDSYMALFMKETGTTNDQLQNLIWWAEKSGKSDDEVKEIMDNISFTRMLEGVDSGAITSQLNDIVTSLNPNKIRSYIAAATIAESEDLDMSFVNDIIKGSFNGTITGEDQAKLGLLGSINDEVSYDQLMEAISNDDYDEFMRLYATAMNDIATSGKYNADSIRMIAEQLGVSVDTIKDYGQIDPNDIQSIIDSIDNNTETVEGMSDTVGRQSQWEQTTNKWSATWFGDMADSFGEFSSDHPFMTAIGAQLGIKGVSAIGKKLFGGALSKFGLGSLGAGGTGGLAGLSGLGTKLTQTIGSIGTKASSALSSAGTTISNAGTSFVNSASSWGASISQGVSGLIASGELAFSEFAAAGGTELLSSFGAYAPAIPDAIRGWEQVISDQSDWNNLSHEERERAVFNGEYRSSQALDFDTYDFKGVNGEQYLQGLQDNLRSGTNDWIEEWVNTYWREYDGELEEAYWNYLDDILNSLDIDIGQNEWDLSTTKEEIREALENLTEEEKNRIINTQALSHDWGSGVTSWSFVEQSQGTLVDDLRRNLIEAYQSEDHYYKGAIVDALNAHGETFDDYSNAELEELLQEALGSSYSRNDAHWWKYGDGDNSNAGGYGSLYFDEFFVNDSFNSLLKGLSESYVPNEESNQELTEAVNSLEATASDMFQWLKDNGYEPTYAWSEDYMRQVYNNAHGISGESNTLSSTMDLMNPALQINGSHADGLDKVPFDGYIAELHKDERVLTADEAKGQDSYIEYSERVDESVVEIGNTLYSIMEILESGFEYIGKKIDDVKVNVTDIQRNTRMSMTSRMFSN